MPAAGALALALALAVATAAIARAADPLPGEGSLIVPAVPDSVSIESEPGPLLLPGGPGPAGGARSAAERAREQFGLGLTLEQGGQYRAAYFAFRNAAQQDPRLPEAHFRQGLMLALTGNLNEATHAFGKELELNPVHRGAQLELGYVLSRLGRHREAIERLQGLLRRDPGRDEHWYALGVAYVAAEQYAAALVPLRRAVRMPPARGEEHRDLGVALAALGRTHEARGEYRRALALDPVDASAWVDLANLERRAGRSDSALAAYRSAERSDSSHAGAYRGQIALLESRPAEKADVYRRWTRAVPDDTEVRLEAVRQFDDLGRRDIALEIARDGVRHNRRSADARMILGMALEASGETRQAMRELRLAAALHRGRAGRERVQHLMNALRAAAPDSMRALFEADSLELATDPTAQPPDSSGSAGQ